MKRARNLFGVTITVSAIACASPSSEVEPKPGPPEPVSEEVAAPQEVAPSCPEESGFCFDVLPEDAVIVVDGKEHGDIASLGPAGSRFLALPPGLHRVVLRRDGYATWRAEVAIAEKAERVQVELRPQTE